MRSSQSWGPAPLYVSSRRDARTGHVAVEPVDCRQDVAQMEKAPGPHLTHASSNTASQEGRAPLTWAPAPGRPVPPLPSALGGGAKPQPRGFAAAAHGCSQNSASLPAWTGEGQRPRPTGSRAICLGNGQTRRSPPTRPLCGLSSASGAWESCGQRDQVAGLGGEAHRAGSGP